MAYKVKNKKKDLKESINELVANDVKKEISLNALKNRLKEATKKDSIPGLAITTKVHKQAGRDNKEGVDAIVKKIKDYLKYKNNSNPEFPHQNNSKTDYESPMYRNSTEQEDYIDTWRGGGLADLQYDTEPSDEFKKRFAQYLDGSIETGNNDGKGSDGEQVANVVPSKLGKKIQKIMKSKHKKLQGPDGYAIPNDWTQHPNPGFIPESIKKLQVIREQWQTVEMDEQAETAQSKAKDAASKVKDAAAKVGDAASKVVDAESKIKKVQAYCKIAVDGKTGPKTTECIKSIQKKLGLTVDGKLGNDTWESFINKENITESVSHDMDNMQHLFTYNKKTQ